MVHSGERYTLPSMESLCPFVSGVKKYTYVDNTSFVDEHKLMGPNWFAAITFGQEFRRNFTWNYMEIPPPMPPIIEWWV